MLTKKLGAFLNRPLNANNGTIQKATAGSTVCLVCQCSLAVSPSALSKKEWRRRYKVFCKKPTLSNIDQRHKRLLIVL